MVDCAGRTPLYRALTDCTVEVVQALLDGGCDPMHRDIHGLTAFALGTSTQEAKIALALVAAKDAKDGDCRAASSIPA